MQKFTTWIAVIALFVGVVGLFVGDKTYPVIDRVIEKVGAASGPETYTRQFNRGGLTTGGTQSTTTSKASYTLQASDLAGEQSVWLVTPNVELALALSATATHRLIPKVGDTTKILIRNASSTAASSITLSATDANTDLQFGEATGGDLVLNGLDWAELTLVRTSGYLVTVIFNEFTEAD